MAGKPRGSILYDQPLQIFVTKEAAKAFREMAEQEYGGKISVAGRKVLDQVLTEKGYKAAA